MLPVVLDHGEHVVSDIGLETEPVDRYVAGECGIYVVANEQAGVVHVAAQDRSRTLQRLAVSENCDARIYGVRAGRDDDGPILHKAGGSRKVGGVDRLLNTWDAEPMV